MYKKLAVLYACDDNYAPFAGVSILSLLKNNQDLDEIKIFIVLDNVSCDNVDKLEKTVSKYERELIKIDAAELVSLMEELGVPKYRGSYATHYRKFVHLFIPDEIRYLLYVDADTIVTGELSELCNLDMQDKCVGVVLDTLGGKYKQLLGFELDEPYFNAGVAYIDIKLWKERKYAEKLINHIKNERNSYCNPDQDLFNIVLKGDIYVLPIGYNFQPPHRVYSDKSFFFNFPNEYYSEKEIEMARRNPYILHSYRFLGEFPWHKGNLHPDNDIFEWYLKDSEWNGYEKKLSNNNGIMFEVERIMYKVLPKPFFLFVFSKILYLSFYRKNKKLKKQCMNR